MCILRLVVLLCLGVLSACDFNPSVRADKPPRGITPVLSSSHGNSTSSHGNSTSSHGNSSSSHGNQIVSSYSRSYALLIGESNYSQGWSSLGSVPTELKQVEQVLKDQGFVVEKALDLNAAQLRARFEQFINQYGFEAKHRLLFYFGGHGHTRQYHGYDKGYIVPIDAPHPSQDDKGFVQKAINMDQIYAWAKRIEVNHALFVFDSCFSGTILKVRSGEQAPAYINKATAEPVWQFITAGKADERVPAKSVFTPMFVDTLRLKKGDSNQDGYVTGFEVCYHLKTEVPKYRSQHPQCGTIKDYELSKGDFVFAVGKPQRSVGPVSRPDSDRDGVADAQDSCPRNTKAELSQGVYKQGPNIGCPLDNDQDGVADYQDSCPYNQPAELVDGVQSNGCPRDRDRDGVADYRDRCKNNRPNELQQGVAPTGCPLDRDKDNVADYRDNCLGTPAGVRVDNHGCHQVVSAPVRPSPIQSVPPRPEPSVTVVPPRQESVAAMRPGTVFRDRLKGGGYGPEMVWILAGRFQMGDIQGGGNSDEKPVHSVSVAKFAMGRYEVTVGDFRRFVNATGYKTDAEKGGGCWGSNNWSKLTFSQTDKHPVVCVSWNDATAYAKWLSEQTDKQYRLPTEAQWEYAARAGTETKYWWGNDIGSNKANCANYFCGDQFEYTAPVGSFAANPFGLFDTAGNVWEWTCSKYKNKYTGNEQRCANSGSLRAFRSGAWNLMSWYVRAATRTRASHDFRIDYVGLRLARL
jgi:formylglycine-generating enzyme required for sulfatase activity